MIRFDQLTTTATQPCKKPYHKEKKIPVDSVELRFILSRRLSYGGQRAYIIRIRQKAIKYIIILNGLYMPKEKL